MKRICAQCGHDLGHIDSPILGKQSVSHGVCKDCAERILYQGLGEPLDDFLDRLGIPVFLVDSEHEVHTGNRYVCELLGKERADIQGKKFGEVIECTNSKLPGGCGNTVHCKTCAIRNSIHHTFTTGESLSHVPAYRDIEVDLGVKTMCFSISTEKVGGMILLHIEHLREAGPDAATESLEV